jgi:Protein of unknown function (DUF4058)
MPLIDHFHPPLSDERHWESFHATWAIEIMAMLNRGILPRGYFAEAQVHVGSRVEIDVGTFERNGGSPGAAVENGGAAVQVLSPTSVMTMPAAFPDEIEVQIFSTAAGPTLVAAIELVSPGNKDRGEERRAFAAKCAAHLGMGIGLIIVDIVTKRRGNMHDELIRLLQGPDAYLFPGGSHLYSVSYRPLRTEARGAEIEIRPFALAIGQPLPTMSLPLRGGPIIPVDLEVSYTQSRERTLI